MRAEFQCRHGDIRIGESEWCAPLQIFSDRTSAEVTVSDRPITSPIWDALISLMQRLGIQRLKGVGKTPTLWITIPTQVQEFYEEEEFKPEFDPDKKSGLTAVFFPRHGDIRVYEDGKRYGHPYVWCTSAQIFTGGKRCELGPYHSPIDEDMNLAIKTCMSQMGVEKILKVTYPLDKDGNPGPRREVWIPVPPLPKLNRIKERLAEKRKNAQH